MKNAIILHGKPSEDDYYNPTIDAQSNCHWIPWLQQQLNVHDILTQTPEMPHPFEPVYEEWKNIFDQLTVDEHTILIGHSCGGGFLVHWLSEHDIKVDKLILVAPWIDPDKTVQDATFFDFNINVDNKAHTIHILLSTDDEIDVIESVSMLQKEITQHAYHKFSGYGHFTLGEMHTREFPELLAICLGNAQ